MVFNNDKKNILIVVALYEEAVRIKKIAEVFKNELNIKVIFTGVGLVNATYTLTKEIISTKLVGINIDYIINLGSAGGRNDLKKGEVIECSGFIARDVDQTALNFPLGVMHPNSIYLDDREVVIKNFHTITDLKKVICGTGNSFESGDIPFDECDAVEMEAVALAKVAIREDVKFTAIKYITDTNSKSESDSGKDWIENVHSTDEALYDVAKEVLNKILHNKGSVK